MPKQKKEIDSTEEKQLPQLSPRQTELLMLMITSKTDAEAIRKSSYSEAQFYRLKPLLMKYKQKYLATAKQEAIDALNLSAPKAVKELIDELDNRQVKVRNKSANDILGYVGVGKEGNVTNVQVNIANVIDKDTEDYRIDD